MIYDGLPESIKVGAMTYRVDVQNMADRGQTDRDAGVITISNRLGPGRARVTLLHEVMHAMHGHTGQVIIAGDTADDCEENLISLWSGPLLGVLRDNPELVAFLTADADH